MKRFARRALIVTGWIMLALAALWAFAELSARSGLYWTP